MTLDPTTLPPLWATPLKQDIATKLAEHPKKIIVLDDDPTGTQTVHDVPVYTDWSVETLRDAFAQPDILFYILTNSRSLSEADAVSLARELGQNLRTAASQPFALVSRGDSTLRGHYPAEVDALTAALEEPIDAHILIPAFFEGNRETISDVHYIREGKVYTPVSETPFAADAAFGYRNADLKAWVEEKTKGDVRAEEVLSFSLADLRVRGPEFVARTLLASAHPAIIVNAAHYRDLEVFTLGLLDAEAAGKRYVYRTAASFVVTRAGLQKRDLLKAGDFDLSAETGGLVVVGSHVPLTTKQLEYLLARREVHRGGVRGLELEVKRLLGGEDHAAHVAAEASRLVSQGETVVVYTSRELVEKEQVSQTMQLGQRVSAGLIEVVRALEVRPKFIIAKGGITSSDIATKGLGVKKALVRGQLLPGVPVWSLGAESRFPGLDYVVFPGNVGAEDALSVAVAKLLD